MTQATESLTVCEHEPLAPHTSWRIGGAARFYVETDSIETLQHALQWGQKRDLPVFVLGSGTNVLIRDTGFAGLTIRYRAREWHIEDHGNTGLLYVQAGVPIGRLAWIVGAKGWANLEWAAGLPGSIGGAIVGNAGCYGKDIASFLTRAWILNNGQTEEWSAERMEFGYRHSVLKQYAGLSPNGQRLFNGHKKKTYPLVLAGEMTVVRQDMAYLVQATKQIANERKAKTPVGNSCGSVFKNPSGTPLSAGQIIDQAGLKGTRIGAAEVSQHHANYIINLGGASSDDVLHLIDLVQRTVYQQFHIELELEIQVI
jgi:UDP-N-acetylmuramate dehydrogenase